MEREEVQNQIQQALFQVEQTTLDITKTLNANENWEDLLDKSRHMKANEDAQIYRHLNLAFENILDPNTFISIRDTQGHKKSLIIDKYTLEVTVVHRALKIEDIHGVDVVYNFNDKKTLAFQHKKRDKQGFLSFSSNDRLQRDKIANLCNFCKLPGRHKKSNGSFVRPYCGSVYAVGEGYDEVRHVVSACQIEEYRKYYRSTQSQPASSFPVPPNLMMIDQMFLNCTIGFQLGVQKEYLTSQSIEDALLTQPDIVFRAKLSTNVQSKLMDDE